MRYRRAGQLSVFEIPGVAALIKDTPRPTAKFDWAAAGCSARGAWFSDDGLHRLILWRQWQRGPRAMFVMLNPSSASELDDDATIRRCKGFASSWGCGGLWIANLYTLIATDPGELWSTEPHLRQISASVVAGDEPQPRADWFLERALDRTVGPIVAAWGALPRDSAAVLRAAEVLDRLAHRREVQCLGMTASGYPRHPGRIVGMTPLQLFRPSRVVDSTV